MVLTERAAWLAGRLFLAATSLFILAPLIVVVLVSLSPDPTFDIPTGTLSLRWYRKLADLDSLWPAIRASLEVGIAATALSLLLGTMGAVALSRGAFRGKQWLLVFILSPMMLPGVVLGVSMLNAFRAAGLFDSFVALVLGHVVITLPYVVRVLLGALGLFDFRLIDAARTLGVSYPRALGMILVPNLAPSFATAAMFSFLTSVDNYSLALFLSDVRNVTLPIQILKYIDQASDPSIAAIATLMVMLTAIVVVIAERLVGMKRLMGG